MLHHDRIRQDRRVGFEIVLTEAAQPQSLGLQEWSRGQRREAHVLLFAEGKTAEALVEARYLAAGVEQLLVAAGPRRVDLGIDVEVQRVAFLAPGRPGLELGAVGHLDVDHVIIGVSAGFHVIFPWLSCWFPTSSDKL